jgi:transposase
MDSISDKLFSASLKLEGQNREVIVEWMKQMACGNIKFVIMDSTYASTVSEQHGINAKGYNPSHDFDEQIHLMYLFSSEMKQPVYYRHINGNITDFSSMSLCIKEMNVKDVVFIADKGFYRENNIGELDKNQLQYIIPLRRNNQLIDFKPPKQANFKKDIKNYFDYQVRIIWYCQYEKDGKKLITLWMKS